MQNIHQEHIAHPWVWAFPTGRDELLLVRSPATAMLYLDTIKQQPINLHDRFTEMHRMNLHVQNAMDQLEQKINDFLMNIKKNKPE